MRTIRIIKMFKLKPSTFLVALSLLIASASFAAPVNILPLGDSITSDGGNSAYRNELFDKLTTGGYDFEFVGSLPDEDVITQTKHEGHSGWRSIDIINGIPNDIPDAGMLDDWLAQYDADIALIHLGTNDILTGEDDGATLDKLVTIIGKLQADKPAVTILVAKIIQIDSPDKSTGLNSMLDDSWAQAKSTLTSTVIIVDQHAALFNVLADYRDTPPIHPNLTGEKKMAEEWFNSLTSTDLTVTVPSSANSGSTFTITASSNSTKPINYISNSTGTCTANSSGEVTALIPGSCDLGITQTSPLGDITSVTKVVTINAVAQTITFDPPSTKTYGDADFSVTANSNSNLPVSITSTTGTICQIITNNNTITVTELKAGTCTLKATQDGGVAGDITYAPATSVTKNITINKAEQTISIVVAPPLNKTFGDDPFDVTATSFDTKSPPVATDLTVDIGTTTANVCTYNSGTKKVTILSAGTCTLKAVQANDDNYHTKTETIDIIISAKGQNIDFPKISDKVVTSAPFDISATASSTLPVSFLSTTTNVCTVANKTVTLIAIGTCRITATAGNSNNTTASATQEFEVTKASQIVAFANNTPTTKTNKDSPFTISASSSSNLAVTIKSTTQSVCTIDNAHKVSIHSAGSCILKAEQSGNATYTAANASHTIIISLVDSTYDTVVDIINGNSTAVTTTAQLQAIGLKNINTDFDYTKALKSGNYKNKSKPTIAELQKAIDNENSDHIKTAGATSALWLVLLGFIALYRRSKRSF